MGTIISLVEGREALGNEWAGLNDWAGPIGPAVRPVEAVAECAKRNVDILLVDKAACEEGLDSLISKVRLADPQVDIIIFSCDRSDMERYGSQANVHLYGTGIGEDLIGLQTSIQRILHTRQCISAKRELEAWSNDFLDNAIVLIQSVDPRGKLIYTNRTWREVLGYSAEEVLGMNLQDVIDPDCLPKCMERFQEVMSGKDPGIVEAQFLTKSGKKVFVEGQVNCRFVDGRPAYTRGIFRDITTKKLAEEGLLMANKKLSLMNGIVRHDVLNQLMVLSGYLELAESKVDSPILSKYLVKEMAAVSNIDRLISFTKTYQDIGVKAPVWNNIGNLVPIMKSALKDSEMSLEVCESCGEIFADQMFEQVLYNLVDNTVKYAGTASNISLTWTGRAAGGCLIYRDDGQGIPVEDKGKIFERGYGHNTGLGLFLAREILSFTDIQIVENGVPGKGARFEMTVPAACYRAKAR